MVGKRRYYDGCAIAHGLDLIGERWSLLIIRELIFGPKRFSDLCSDLPGVSTDVLSQRLRDLGTAGVLRRRRLARPAASWVYELTDWGAELEPVLSQLAYWSSRSPGLRGDLPLGVDSFMLSLKTLFDERAAKGISWTIDVRIGEDEFVITVADQEITVERGRRQDADLTMETDVPTLQAITHGAEPIDQLLADSRIDGDPSVLHTWRQLFRRPEVATVSDP